MSQSSQSISELNQARIESSPIQFTPSSKKIKQWKMLALQQGKYSKSNSQNPIIKKRRNQFSDLQDQKNDPLDKIRKIIQQVRQSQIKSKQNEKLQTKVKHEEILEIKSQALTISAPKLKKLRKPVHYTQVCPICLCPPQDPVGELDSCMHKFCFECIQFWSQSSNKCPCCRKQYKQIIKNKQQRIKVIQKNLVVQDAQDYLQIPCYICNTFDNVHVLLLCDQCQTYCCHVYCDPSLNNLIPQSDWYCAFCVNQQDQSAFSQSQFSQVVQQKNSRPFIIQSQQQSQQQSALYSQVAVRNVGTVAARTRSKLNNRNPSESRGVVGRLRSARMIM